MLLVTFLFCGKGVLAFAERPSTDPTRPEISRSAVPAVLGLATFLGFVVSIPRPIPPRWRSVFRFGWTWACLTYLVHVAIAFHLGHDWSHANAYDHVERRSGFGPGIFLSYLFTVVWVGDVIWVWVDYRSYRNRPRWISRTVAGFLGFVTFNATVVFGSGEVRVLGIALTSLTVLSVGIERLRNRTSSPQDGTPASLRVE